MITEKFTSDVKREKQPTSYDSQQGCDKKMSKGFIRRVATFCPVRNCQVNQEISFRVVGKEKEMTASCTGVSEACEDCFIVKIGEGYQNS